MLQDHDRSLLQVLAGCVPLPREGVRVVERALERAGRPALPAEPELLHAFVHDELRSVLADELGPRLAAEIVRDITRATAALPSTHAAHALRARDTTPAAPSSKRVRAASPSSTVRDGQHGLVVVLGQDRVRDATTARALIRAGFDVVVPRDGVELEAAFDRGAHEAPVAVVADEPSVRSAPVALRERIEGDTVLLAYGCGDAPRAESTLRALGARRVCALSAGCGTADVVTTLIALIGG